MNTVQKNTTLVQFQQSLLDIQTGVFQENDYLLSWCNPAVSALLNDHAVELVPQRIVYTVGRPLDCHRNALEYATMNEETSAWFGFSLSLGCWWLHSWVLEVDGTLLDSGQPTTPAHYVGFPWGLELYEAITKREDSSLPLEASSPTLSLPPVLARRALATYPSRCSGECEGSG